MLVIVILAGCDAPGEDGERLRIHGVTYPGDVPTLVADRQGIFEAEGVKSTVAYGSSGKQNLELLRRGETDFALMALTPLVIDMLNDPTPGGADDPVILANLLHATNLNQVISLARTGLDTPADFRNRRVGLMKGTKAEFVWWLFTTYHGLDPAVQLLDRPVETLADALLAGEIDAAVLWEPWTTRLRQRAGDLLRVHAGSQVYTANWMLVALRQTVADMPAETRALFRAYRAAIGFIDGHGREAFDLYADHAGLSTEVVQRFRQNVSYELSLDWSLVSALQQQVDWAQMAGYAPRGHTVDVLSLIDAEPLRAVAPTSGGLILSRPDSESAAP